MRITHVICSQNEWHVAIFYRISQTKFHHRQRRLPDSTNGWLYRYVIRSQVFSTLKYNSSYWKIAIDEQYSDKTAFVSNHDPFRFARIPFGLTNAGSIFQRSIYIVLSLLRWKFAIVYLDDIIVLSKADEHIGHLKAFTTLMKDGCLTFNLCKCFFLKTLVEYSGHIVIPGCLHVP